MHTPITPGTVLSTWVSLSSLKSSPQFTRLCYHSYLKQDLAYSRWSINLCWMNGFPLYRWGNSYWKRLNKMSQVAHMIKLGFESTCFWVYSPCLYPWWQTASWYLQGTCHKALLSQWQISYPSSSLMFLVGIHRSWHTEACLECQPSPAQ